MDTEQTQAEQTKELDRVDREICPACGSDHHRARHDLFMKLCDGEWRVAERLLFTCYRCECNWEQSTDRQLNIDKQYEQKKESY